eukprot:GFKZ01008410.1.p2 GENE.GFKZ01008410.1~~GFKZ01008410.1.p2  ORF type:complete len:148 (+),score=13.30 GFKZ01008410.1:78-521(+)
MRRSPTVATHQALVRSHLTRKLALRRARSRIVKGGTPGRKRLQMMGQEVVQFAAEACVVRRVAGGVEDQAATEGQAGQTVAPDRCGGWEGGVIGILRRVWVLWVVMVCVSDHQKFARAMFVALRVADGAVVVVVTGGRGGDKRVAPR